MRQQVPLKTIAAIVGTLVYVLSPIDIIPDFIPGFGYLDDAGVVELCRRLIKSDIDKYRAWKESGNQKAA